MSGSAPVSDERLNAIAIVNPAAGGGRAGENWPAIEATLRRRFPRLRTAMTQARGHGTTLCRDALEAGAEAVFAVGGDGTNNEILAGFCDDQGLNRFPAVQLGIVAAGTGGDFQRTLGTGTLGTRLRQLMDATPRKIDYGIAALCTGDGSETRARPFLNVASVGVSGAIVGHVDQSDKKLGPTATYVLGSLRGIASWRNQQVTVAFDDAPPRRIDLTLACIANGRSFGAGMKCCPQAEIDDGVFDVLTLVGMSRRHLVANLPKIFGGRHLRVRGVDGARAATVEMAPVSASVEVPVELDGEVAGRLPAVFQIAAGALTLRG